MMDKKTLNDRFKNERLILINGAKIATQAWVFKKHGAVV